MRAYIDQRQKFTDVTEVLPASAKKPKQAPSKPSPGMTAERVQGFKFSRNTNRNAAPTKAVPWSDIPEWRDADSTALPYGN
jgi:hypothetical protein